MGNNDPRDAKYEDSQQVHGHSNGRPRVGLTPTEGQDAYKRSSNRSSRRARSERTSYLMATGHLDIEETQQLTKPTQYQSSQSENNPPFNDNTKNNINNKQLQTITTSNNDNTPMIPMKPSSASKRAGISGDQAFLDYVASSNNNHHFDVHDSIFAHNNFNNSNKLKSHSSRSNNSKDNRGTFRQTTYTEVTLPMKTSPAFEYILKDNRRRNRRCCLWLLYSTLMTICVAIIVFSCAHLILRYQSNN